MWDKIPGRDDEKLREEAGFLWAKRDFDAAFAWVLTLRDVTSEWSLGGEAAEGGGAARSAAGAGAGTRRGVHGLVDVSSSAGKWANADPVAAVRWSLEHGDGWLGSLGVLWRTRGAFVRALFEARIDWSKAKYGRSELPAVVRDAAVVGAMSGLAKDDPKAALKYLETLAPGELKGRAEKEIAGWSATDAKAAAEWLTGCLVRMGRLTRGRAGGRRDPRRRGRGARLSRAVGRGQAGAGGRAVVASAGRFAVAADSAGDDFGNLIRGRAEAKAVAISDARPGLSAAQKGEILERGRAATKE